MDFFIQNARAGFAHGLFEAKAQQDGQTPKFSCDLIIDAKTKVFKVVVDEAGKKTRVPTTMEAAMLEVANAGWKGKGKQVLDTLEASKKCYRDGNKHISKKTMEVYDGFEGVWYVAAKNPTQPTLRDMDGRTELTAKSGRPYSGCRINSLLDVYAMTDPKKMGVFATLLSVQFAGHDEAFSGGARVSTGDEFEALDADADAGMV